MNPPFKFNTKKVCIWCNKKIDKKAKWKFLRANYLATTVWGVPEVSHFYTLHNNCSIKYRKNVASSRRFEGLE